MAQEFSKPASTTISLDIELLSFPKPSGASFGDLMMALPEYMVDAFQRSVLFFDLLRQRGNDEIKMTSRPMVTVLRFDHEVLMSGRSLARPINYHLSRIVPLPGVATDPRKRPVVVVDPRAGQGPHWWLQGRERDRRCPECRPSGLFHRFWRNAYARPAVRGRRRGAG